jgi:hypothetical protein
MRKYFFNLGNKEGTNNWGNGRFGYSLASPTSLISGRDSDIDWVFNSTPTKIRQRNKEGEWKEKEETTQYYLATCQGSDDAIKTATLIFSGVWCNKKVIDSTLNTMFTQFCRLRHRPTSLKWGGAFKDSKEVPYIAGMAPNFPYNSQKPYIIEADKKDAPLVAEALHISFNKNHDVWRRPGCLPFRAAISPGLLPSSNSASSEAQRKELFMKHKTHLQSFAPTITSFHIKELYGSPHTANGRTFTLHSFCMYLTSPLAPHTDDEGNHVRKDENGLIVRDRRGNPRPPVRLFEQIYQNPTDPNQVDFITTKANAPLAGSIVMILPAVVDALLDRHAVIDWFHITAIPIIENVTWDLDEEGKWLGTFTTSTELDIDEMLDAEEVPNLAPIYFEGLDLQELITDKPIIDTQDAQSLATGLFNSEFGTGQSAGSSSSELSGVSQTHSRVASVAAGITDAGPRAGVTDK